MIILLPTIYPTAGDRLAYPDRSQITLRDQKSII